MSEAFYGTRKRRVFLALSAFAAVAVLLSAREVLLPFVLGLVVAYVLTPAVTWVERRRVPRWAAILVVYALTLGAIGGSLSGMLPRLFAEGKNAAAEWPRLHTRMREQWLPALDAKIAGWTGRPVPAPVEPDANADGIPDRTAPIHVVRRPDGSLDVQIDEGVRFHQVHEGVWQLEDPQPLQQGISTATVLQRGFDKVSGYLQSNSLEVLKIGQGIVMGISRGIFNLFMTLMLGAYMILTRERILAFFRDLWAPGSRDAFDRFLRRLDRGLSGVVRGQLLICLVNGVLSAIGFWLFDLKYWPILALVAAVMSLIPIFGSIMSSVPAVAIGITQSPGTAFGVLAWIIGIHQLEANFLNPKIIGDAAKIHPVLVVFSLLAGEHAFGIVGALFGVPCMSIAQTVFLHFRETTLGLADPSASVPPPPQRSTREPPIVPTPKPSSPVTERSPESRAAGG